MHNNCLPTSSQSNLSSVQIQQVCREAPANQFIMTSSGQILLMPSPQPNKTGSQVILGNASSGGTIVMNHSPQNMVINSSHGPQIISSEIIQGLNDGHTLTAQPSIMPNSGNNVVIQSPGIIPGGQNIIQPGNNVLSNNAGTILSANNSNFIVSSPNNTLQSMLQLNSSNIIQHNGNVLQQATSNLIPTNSGSIITTANGTKVISNGANILNAQNIITNQPNVLTANNQIISNNSGLMSPNANGIVGQQTVVLNQLANGGYVIQPQSFATVDGQVINVLNSDGSNQFIQQTQQRIILSPDSKHRAKKRKSSSATPPTPQNLSPQQSPTIQHQSQPQQQQQTNTMLQITPQYQSQSFQISPGMQGITLIQNKPQSSNPAPQQQILLQNGQTILQPMNLMGQQLLVPAGVMMAPDTALLQIQNMGGSIIAPQSTMVIRAPSPQNKGFLSPNSGGQQFIVSGNGQISPIGQMYSTPMGLVVPHSTAGPTYTVQNTTIVQQQTTMMSSGNGVGAEQNRINSHSLGVQPVPASATRAATQAQVTIPHQIAASPPDTTTHSPRSPERPPSQKSGGSDINMV